MLGGKSMKNVTKKPTSKSCCTTYTTAQCCSKSSKIVAGCHN